MVKPIHDNEVVKSLKNEYRYGSAFSEKKTDFDKEICLFLAKFAFCELNVRHTLNYFVAKLIFGQLMANLI